MHNGLKKELIHNWVTLRSWAGYSFKLQTFSPCFSFVYQVGRVGTCHESFSRNSVQWRIPNSNTITYYFSSASTFHCHWKFMGKIFVRKSWDIFLKSTFRATAGPSLFVDFLPGGNRGWNSHNFRLFWQLHDLCWYWTLLFDWRRVFNSWASSSVCDAHKVFAEISL